MDIIDINGAKLSTELLAEIKDYQGNNFCGVDIQCEKIADLICTLARGMSEMDTELVETIKEVMEHLSWDREFMKMLRV